MEKFEQINKKEPQKNKEDFRKNTITLPDGRIIEGYYDLKNGQLKEYLIKDKQGNVLSFADLRNNKNTSEIIKENLLKKGIVLTDEEVKKILPDIIESSMNAILDKIDENNSIEN